MKVPETKENSYFDRNESAVIDVKYYILLLEKENYYDRIFINIIKFIRIQRK